MDVIQAGILNFRLKKLNTTIKKRRANANFYLKNIDNEFYKLINEKKYQYNTYHTFVIQTPRREKLIKFLKNHKVHTAIHYPIPIHLQPAAKRLGYKKGDFPVAEIQSRKILTLPIHQDLKKSDIIRVCKLINKFVGK